MAIRIVKDRISRTELKVLSGESPAGAVKVVADLDKKVLGIGGPMHRDIEIVLLSDGASLHNLWGFSLYPDRPWENAFEFRSHVNIRPQDGNHSIQIQDKKLCDLLVALAAARIDWKC